MSKGIRFSESAIAGGRVGTARIHTEISGAAVRLASTDPVPLDAAIKALVVRSDVATDRIEIDIPNWSAPTPLDGWQKLGRLGTGKMNKTEEAYSQVLAARLHIGEILWYRFEAHKLRLADNTFYTPDFAVMVANGNTEYHEVKGYWTDKARAKTKVAASQHPYRFIAVKRAGRHRWQFEDMTSKSW